MLDKQCIVSIVERKGHKHTSTGRARCIPLPSSLPFPFLDCLLNLSLSLFLSLLLSWHDFFKTRRRCELQITQQVKCNCDVILSPIWEFLKMGVPKTIGSILKWSNFGWFGGTPILGNLHMFLLCSYWKIQVPCAHSPCAPHLPESAGLSPSRSKANG